MTASQLSLFARPAAVSQPSTALPFVPTHEVFVGAVCWRDEPRGDESALEKTFRDQSELEWARVRAELERLATVALEEAQAATPPQGEAAGPEEGPAPIGEPPPSTEPVAEGQSAPLPQPAEVLPIAVHPLDAVSAGPVGAGVVYSVTPELSQVALALPAGGVTVVAARTLESAEETPALVKLRGEIEELRVRLGIAGTALP